MFTSWDNINFTRVADGYGTNRAVEADLQGYKNARYLRIVSDGTSDHWWSIAENRHLQRQQRGPQPLDDHLHRR